MSSSYSEAPATGSQTRMGLAVAQPCGFSPLSSNASSRTCSPLIVSPFCSIGGIVSKNCINEAAVGSWDPGLQSPCAPSALIGRTRQKYVLFGRGLVGEYPVATVGVEQQTRELLLKSCEKLMSSSYLAAPGTAPQVSRGSKSCRASIGFWVIRFWVAHVVSVGQLQLNERTTELLPWCFSASTGVTVQ